jgi:hypothetical protein
MKKKDRDSRAENISETSSEKESARDRTTSSLGGKKKTLIEKLDILSEEIQNCKNLHLKILSVMADNNSKIIEDIQRQILALKENISGPEKKKFKKTKLADELNDLQKSGKKIGLKPELGRKKDLERIDDYLLGAFQILDSLNDKFLNEHLSSEPSPN